MLARYDFNDIIQYLNDDNLEAIYDEKHLTIINNTEVKHDKYNFIFNHDYKISNGKIINYNEIVLRFKEKIVDWNNMRNDKISQCVFLHFSITNTVDNLNIQEMMTALRNQRPEGPIYLFIFTDTLYKSIDIPNVSIIQIEGGRIMFPWEMTPHNRKIASQHVYSKFIETLNINNIQHSFPLNVV